VGDFRPDPTGLFTLAVAYGQVTPAALKQQRIHYLALGGRHDRFTCSASPQGAHFPGTPQGRCPDESGPHGCTVVTVDESGRPRTRFAPTDAVRWVNERVVFERQEPLDKIGDHLVQRMQEIRQRSGEIDLVVCWSITAAGADHNRAAAAMTLLERLRDQFRQESPLAWSASLTIEPPDHRLAPPEHDESILAELLRLVDQHRGDEQAIDLSEVFPDRHSGGILASAARVDDAEERRHLLREVALLGSELLGPHPDANADSEEMQA
jgi:DNA repair exonuclease SbcCD nuclease subunit